MNVELSIAILSLCISSPMVRANLLLAVARTLILTEMTEHANRYNLLVSYKDI